MNIFLKTILLCVVIGILLPVTYVFFTWLWQVKMDDLGMYKFLLKTLMGTAAVAFIFFILDKVWGW